VIHHPWRTDPELAARYPSHLHVNLESRLQGSGYGTRLTRTLIAALRDGPRVDFPAGRPVLAAGQARRRPRFA
jgi:hypothetical protein